MPRFRQVIQIQELMDAKEAIRNVGIIAHIDHGKTTLADSLLSGVGMLASSMAGTARVLDYLAEEQKRKITIKTANISLVYKTLDGSYLVNLVDTPGHVDFTGKVTRALRTIDGAIVVVDAVEGIMAQTEIVTRQALKEGVCPILFINKIDRLITELQLNAEQIQERLNQLIDCFNDLIEVYSESPYNTQWKVSPQRGNVAFGAALHGWGFTVGIAKQKAVKFQDIIMAYHQQDVEKLKKTIPIHKAIFEMVINTLPNPREAQAYRVRTLQKTANSAIEHALATCQNEGPTVMYITNVVAMSEGGCMAIGRVFSGKICKDDKAYLVNVSKEVGVGNVYLDMGFFQEEVLEVSAGNLVRVSLPIMVKAGEMLVDVDHKDMSSFECISYVSEPVMTVAVEPKMPQQTVELFEALEKMASEDPNLHVSIHKETGEYLLSGIGELHLELAAKQLERDFGLEVKVSLPMVVYMESVIHQGIAIHIKGLNNQNVFSIQVENRQENQKLPSEIIDVLYVDANGNSLVTCNQVFSESVLKSAIKGFEYACKAGPLCGEPLRCVEVKLFNMQPNLNYDKAGDVTREISKAIFASFLTAKPVLLEPIYAITVTVSFDLAGECSRILTTHRGKVGSFEQKGLLSTIKGSIPVAETFAFSKEIRSATSGRAIWQYLFDHWEELPKRQAAQTIVELRKRKGLAEEVPKPDKFMENLK